MVSQTSMRPSRDLVASRLPGRKRMQSMASQCCAPLSDASSYDIAQLYYLCLTSPKGPLSRIVAWRLSNGMSPLLAASHGIADLHADCGIRAQQVLVHLPLRETVHTNWCNFLFYPQA